ncbi:MAG: aspartate kinase [Bacteroidota bacterium]
MKNNLQLHKFGGASIKDERAIQNVGAIVQSLKNQAIVIVVSAMGKTTNALEKLLDHYLNEEADAFRVLEEIKNHHIQVAQQLFEANHDIFNTINDTFVEIEWIIEEEPQDGYDYLYDQIVSVGELASTRIVAAYLSQQGLTIQWLDARDVIHTDNTYREGQIDWNLTQQRCQEVIPPLLTAGKIVLTQGFIGATSENFTTTLGREGSDFSAAILAYCLDAERMSIWKDVPGVMTADPRLFAAVSKIDRLSYKEAIEMTYYGAKVLHPKTIKPLQNKNIPLYVKSFVEPTGEGTYVGGDVEEQYPPVIVIEGNQSLLHISTRDFSFVAEHHLSNLFQSFAKHRIKINTMQNMAISFSVCVGNSPQRLALLLADLEADFKVVQQHDLELITVRHFQEDLLEQLIKGKMVLFEERIRNTIQMVVRDLPSMQRIEKS